MQRRKFSRDFKLQAVKLGAGVRGIGGAGGPRFGFARERAAQVGT